jgi:UDP-N-acetylmuramoylalanine--D-glutamate ligase
MVMAAAKRVLVMGLGLHGGGAGAANYFTERGFDVTVTDIKPAEELEEGLRLLKHGDRIRFVLGEHEFRDFEEADLIIKNPGVPPDSPYIAHALRAGVRVDTDIGIFLDQVAGRARGIYGITGTKGKSTTASLIHTILSLEGHSLLGGNITVSVLDLVDSVRDDTRIVLELSSFQLGGIRDRGFSPQVAVITNFLDDHLNYYRSREDYYEDKRVIFRNQKPGDLLVLNRDNRVYEMATPNRDVRLVSFGLDAGFEGDGSYVHDDWLLYRRDGETLRVVPASSIALPGRHNLYNVLAAVSTALAQGLSTESVARGVERFGGLPHRLEEVATFDGLRFVNDSAATTPDAAVQALMGVEGPITLIAGGSDKGLALGSLVEAMNRRAERLVLLDGSGTNRLIGAGLEKAYRVFDTLEDALEYACSVSAPGFTVLLSPGFASFGMFRNEFDRGDRFKTLVRGMNRTNP